MIQGPAWWFLWRYFLMGCDVFLWDVSAIMQLYLNSWFLLPMCLFMLVVITSEFWFQWMQGWAEFYCKFQACRQNLILNLIAYAVFWAVQLSPMQSTSLPGVVLPRRICIRIKSYLIGVQKQEARRTQGSVSRWINRPSTSEAVRMICHSAVKAAFVCWVFA